MFSGAFLLTFWLLLAGAESRAGGQCSKLPPSKRALGRNAKGESVCFGLLKQGRFSWPDARQACRANGGRLATIHADSLAAVFAIKVGCKGIWIDLIQEPHSRAHPLKGDLKSNWFWQGSRHQRLTDMRSRSEGGPWDGYQPNSGYPTEPVVAINRGGFHDWPISAVKRPLCMYSIASTPRAKIVI